MLRKCLALEKPERKENEEEKCISFSLFLSNQRHLCKFLCKSNTLLIMWFPSLEEMNRSAASFLCQLSHKVSSLAFTGSMSSKSYQLGRRRWKLEIMNLRLLLLKRVLGNNIESTFSLRILGSYSYQLRTFVLYPAQ